MTHKKVYFQTGKLVVLSWQDNTGTASNKDYKLHVYSVNAGTFTLIHTSTGTSFDGVPSMAISSTYNTIIVYHKSITSPYPLVIISKIIDYAAGTSSNLILSSYINSNNDI